VLGCVDAFAGFPDHELEGFSSIAEEGIDYAVNQPKG
jgi:hypothetical protein